MLKPQQIVTHIYARLADFVYLKVFLKSRFKEDTFSCYYFHIVIPVCVFFVFSFLFFNVFLKYFLKIYVRKFTI